MSQFAHTAAAAAWGIVARRGQLCPTPGRGIRHRFGRSRTGTLVPMRTSGVDEAAIRSTLDFLRGSNEQYGDAVLDTGLAYLPGHPVRIHVRKRGGRYDLTDAAAAISLAGRPSGWLATASETVAEMGMNVNRRGVVYVTGFERRDVAGLVARLAECSRVVYVSLLDSTA